MIWKIRGSWAAGALFALALVLYWGSLRYPLVFDDGQLLGERFLRFDAAAILHLDMRWLSTASFGWTRAAFGPDWAWQRMLNVLLHAAVASCLFFFLRRLFAAAPAAQTPGSDACAFSGALLFLVHPASVYGVAYLIERSIVMATLFGLVSLWLFLEGLLRNRQAWFVASAAAYFAALFCKEHAIMLPAVAAALAVLLRGVSWRAWRPLALPFALCAATALLVVLKVRGLLGTRYEPYVEAALRQLGEPERGSGEANAYLLSILNQGHLFFRYLLIWLLPWPGWMSIDLRPGFPAQLLSWPQTAGFLAWLAWPLAAGALLLRRGRAGLLGLAMLAPWLLALTEMATVRVQEMFVLYRSYLWMVLLPVALPALLGSLRPRWVLALPAAAALALLPAFFDRLGSFSSEVKIWGDAIQKQGDFAAPFADRAWRNRGVAYYKAGRDDAALADFERALKLDPRSALGWMTRGSLHMRAGRSGEARADFDRALEREPRHAETLARRCLVLMRLERLEAALADCRLAAELNPGDTDSYTSLGMVRALRRETTQAEQLYRRALELDAADGNANYQYGVLLRGLGKNAQARQRFATACAAGLRPACAAAGVP